VRRLFIEQVRKRLRYPSILRLSAAVLPQTYPQNSWIDAVDCSAADGEVGIWAVAGLQETVSKKCTAPYCYNDASSADLKLSGSKSHNGAWSGRFDDGEQVALAATVSKVDWCTQVLGNELAGMAGVQAFVRCKKAVA
jgi:hypothetical protein